MPLTALNYEKGKKGARLTRAERQLFTVFIFEFESAEQACFDLWHLLFQLTVPSLISHKQQAVRYDLTAILPKFETFKARSETGACSSLSRCHRQ